MKKDFCTLYIIRHGETEWNKERRIQGHSDSPLSDIGVEQAKNVPSLFPGVMFSAIYSSDLARTLKTAEIVSKRLKVSIHTSHDLRERKFGRFEGIRRADNEQEWQHIHEKHAKLLKEEQWNFAPDDGVESNAELAERFTNRLQRIARQHIGENILVSTHAGCIRTFLMRVGYVPHGSRARIENSGYIIARSDGEAFEVVKAAGGVIIGPDNGKWG